MLKTVMTPSEKIKHILPDDCDGCNLQVCLASIADKNADVPTYEKLQMSNDVVDEFRSIITTILATTHKSLDTNDFRLIDYDPGNVAVSDAVEVLSAEGELDLGKQFAELFSIPNIPIFVADEKFVGNLKFYAIVVEISDGRKAVFFKCYTPKNELARKSFLSIRLYHSRFDLVKEPTFLFDKKIDCIAIDGSIFILNKTNFHKIFRFFDGLKEAGRQTLNDISSRIPISNLDLLYDSCERNILKLAKLRNIAAKPYLAQVTMSDIEGLITEFDLKCKVEEVDGNKHLIYDDARINGRFYAFLMMITLIHD